MHSKDRQPIDRIHDAAVIELPGGSYINALNEPLNPEDFDPSEFSRPGFSEERVKNAILGLSRIGDGSADLPPGGEHIQKVRRVEPVAESLPSPHGPSHDSGSIEKKDTRLNRDRRP